LNGKVAFSSNNFLDFLNWKKNPWNHNVLKENLEELCYSSYMIEKEKRQMKGRLIETIIKPKPKT
jgi:hypothetical protein